MITITEANRALMRTCSDPIFYVVITKSTAGNWPDGYSKHAYGNRTISHASPPATTRYFHNRMDKQSIRGVETTIDEKTGGGLAQVGILEFQVADDDNAYAALNAAGIYYEGRAVALYLAFKASASGAEDLLLWTGSIIEVERDPVGGTVTCRCEDTSVQNDKETPPNRYSSGTTDPEWVRGKPKQLVFGTHDACPGVRTTNISPLPRGGDCGPSYLFADPTIADGIKDIYSPQVGSDGLVQATGGFATIVTAVSPFTIEVTNSKLYFANPDANGTTIQVRMDIALGEFVKGGTYAPWWGVTDAEWARCVDDDDATYTPLRLADWNFESAIPIKIPPINLAGDIPRISGTTPKIYVAHKINAWSSNATPQVYRVGFCADRDVAPMTDGPSLFFHDFATGTFLVPTIENTAAGSETIYFNSHAGTTGSLDTLQQLGQGYLFYGVAVPTAGAGDGSNIDIYEARSLRVYADIEYPQERGLYATVLGYRDTFGGEVTGSAYGLIENPAHVASFICRTLSNAGASVQTTVDFQAVAAKRAGWKVGRFIDEAMQTNDLLDELGEMAGFWTWCDNQGRYRAFTADRVTAPTFTLGRGMIVGPSLRKAKQTPLRDVADSFKFRYKFNPVIDELTETLECTATSSSASLGATYEAMCATAKERFCNGKDIPITLDAPWLRDEATAVLWAKRMIAWLTARRWAIEFDMDLESMFYELGDTFDFAPAQWPALAQDILASQFVITGTRPNPDKDTISITALQTA